MSSLIRDLRTRVSPPWLALVVLFICFIWGNSLVAGEGSGSLSLAVMDWVHGVLRACGLPYEWVTNFAIRKTAHFTEYLVLSLIALHAFDPKRDTSGESIIAAFVLVMLVSSIDETIQLFVPGRSGQVTDALIDCSGAAVGILVRTILVRARHRSRGDVEASG